VVKRDEASGFTLIELMVVVVVLAVLVGVAYPGYQDHLRKAKRAEAKAALLKTAQVLERYYSDKSTYATCPLAAPTAIDPAPVFALACGATVYSGENAADNKSPYTITAVAATGACPVDTCFQITATPNAPFVDPLCDKFTLTSTGARASTGGTGSATDKCKW